MGKELEGFDYEMAKLAEEGEGRGQVIVINELEELEGRIAKKPFLVEHANNRRLAKPVTRILQFISAVLAYYGMHVMLEFIPVPHPWITHVITALVLFAMEYCKLKTSDKAHDSIHAWRKNVVDLKGNRIKIKWNYVVATIIVGVFSVLLSGAGVWFMAGDFGGNAKLIGSGSDPVSQGFLSELETAEADYAAWKLERSNLTHDHGELVIKHSLWPAQKEKEAHIAKLKDNLAAAGIPLVAANAKIRQEWAIRGQFQKYSSSLFSIICEILFELIMSFCSLYDVKKLMYLRLIAAQKGKGKGSRSRTSGKRRALMTG